MPQHRVEWEDRDGAGTLTDRESRPRDERDVRVVDGGLKQGLASLPERHGVGGDGDDVVAPLCEVEDAQEVVLECRNVEDSRELNGSHFPSINDGNEHYSAYPYQTHRCLTSALCAFPLCFLGFPDCTHVLEALRSAQSR